MPVCESNFEKLMSVVHFSNEFASLLHFLSRIAIFYTSLPIPAPPDKSD